VSQPDKNKLIFDWAEAGPRNVDWPQRVMIDDETLRDGLQSPSVTDPPLEVKVELLHLMDSLGIETADIGLPGAGHRQLDSVTRLCREIADNNLDIRPNCAARTLMIDIQPIAEVSQKTGLPIEACVFIGSSPIRQYAEDWEIDNILRFTRDAVQFAVDEGLPVMYVTEDTIRSDPEHLKVLLTAAIESGAKRVCLCDTVGAGVPEGVFNLVTWVQELITDLDTEVGIDWHGHRDRGLDLANTLAAIQGGATRVHGTALGIGERVGNTPIEQLLVNFKLLGIRDDDLTQLPRYVELAAESTGIPIPINAPIVGRDAFRTATGVHAAAVIKAHKKGDAWLADQVYSGVPAGWIGRAQEIEIGPMSGLSNVNFYLRSRGIPDEDSLAKEVLEEAKKSDSTLSEERIMEIVESHQQASKA
jgi:2-isopropylmalate synthase